MIKLTINKISTQLPLKKAKGTVQQRLQKAIDMNDRFYESIKDDFLEKDVTVFNYKKKLKKVIGAPVKVDISDSSYIVPNESNGAMLISGDGKLESYDLSLPLNITTGRLSRRNIRYYMHENLHILERILNPKYNTRTLALVNKGYDMKPVTGFYKEKLYIKRPLKPEDLDIFLKCKKNEEKINTLQYLRYNLLMEKHAHEYIEKNLERFKHLFAGDAVVKYDKTTPKYMFDEKIKILEDKLAAVLKEERQTNKFLVV